jgi:hypothetical protein
VKKGNLSIWHCLVLYCCGNASIDRLAERGDLSVSLLNQARVVEKWDSKKAQFLKLPPRQKTSLDVLELLFGEFQDDEAKKGFVQKVIDKLKSTNKFSKVDKVGIKLQKVSQLTEFGMSHEQATEFIEEVEKNLVGSKVALADDFSDVIPKKLSIQDKLDIVNKSYNYHVFGYNGQLAICQKILKDTIKLYLEEIIALKAIRPQSNDFEEIAERIHTLIYNNYQFLFRLIQLYNEKKNFSS